MHYFIDGYNLMFRISRAGDDLQKQRQEIIQDLETKINFLNLNVTLVFDAQYQRSEASRSHINRLEILFTNAGETADEFILQALKEDTKPHLITVVTSDKKLAWLARRRHANTETVEEFINLLNRRYKNKLISKKTSRALIQPVVPKKKPLSVQQPIKTSPEDYFDFYLNQFEKSYAALAEEKHAKKEAKTSQKKLHKKKNKKPSDQVNDEASIMQRWLKAFNRDVSTDD